MNFFGYLLIFMGIGSVLVIYLHSFALLGETIETYYKFAGLLIAFFIFFVGGYTLLGLATEERSKQKKYAGSAGTIFFVIGVISGLIYLIGLTNLVTLQDAGSLLVLGSLSFIAGFVTVIIADNL